MDENENKLRSESKRLNQLKITDCSQKKPYVFISYKSDDWRIALEDIAFHMQKKYGLRIYYDRAFESNNDSWIKSMKENMESSKCIAVIAVYSEKYINSYATLLEILTSQKKIRDRTKDIIPVFIKGKLHEKEIEIGSLRDYSEIMEDEEDSPKRTNIKKTEWDALMECIDNFNLPSNNRTDQLVKKACEQIRHVGNCEDLTTRVVRECFCDMEEKIASNQNKSWLGDNFYVNLYKTISTVENEVHNSSILRTQTLNSVFDETLKNEDDLSIPKTPGKGTIVIPDPPTPVSIGEIRKVFENSQRAKEFRPIRESMPRGGKGAMDYAMAAILGGCNGVKESSPEYQINYYSCVVASMENKKEGAGLGATWTWSSNCRKTLGLEKAGQIPKEYNDYFRNLSDCLTLQELKKDFISGDKAPYVLEEKKKELVLNAIDKISDFMSKPYA